MVTQEPRSVPLVAIAVCLVVILGNQYLVAGAIVGYIFVVSFLVYVFRIYT